MTAAPFKTTREAIEMAELVVLRERDRATAAEHDASAISLECAAVDVRALLSRCTAPPASADLAAGKLAQQAEDKARAMQLAEAADRARQEYLDSQAIPIEAADLGARITAVASAAREGDAAIIAQIGDVHGMLDDHNCPGFHDDRCPLCEADDLLQRFAARLTTAPASAPPAAAVDVEALLRWCDEYAGPTTTVREAIRAFFAPPTPGEK